MALDITPGHPLVMKYLEYQPASTDSDVRARWKKMVHDPVYKAVHRYLPVLKKHNMMDQVFRVPGSRRARRSVGSTGHPQAVAP